MNAHVMFRCGVCGAIWYSSAQAARCCSPTWVWRCGICNADYIELYENDARAREAAEACCTTQQPKASESQEPQGKVKKQPPDLTAGEFNRREC